jgi:hypothetical protein
MFFVTQGYKLLLLFWNETLLINKFQKDLLKFKSIEKSLFDLYVINFIIARTLL